MKICDRIQLPDDVTIGYVAGKLMKRERIAHCVTSFMVGAEEDK
jgi:hypothetical protein